MKTKIYALQDENGQVRYIGKTGTNLLKRFYQHLSEARCGKINHRCNWIRSQLAKGFVPAIIEIGEVDGDGCREEIAWIKYFRDEGVRLVNMTDGGEGLTGPALTQEVIMKRGMSRKGCAVSIEMRRKISMTLKGRRQPIEVVKKISSSLKGHTCSEATRQKIRLSNTGKQCSEEARRKISIANKGRASSMRGKCHSEESNRKNRLAHLGKVPSFDTRLKISAANKAAWIRIKERRNQ